MTNSYFSFLKTNTSQNIVRQSEAAFHIFSKVKPINLPATGPSLYLQLFANKKTNSRTVPVTGAECSTIRVYYGEKRYMAR